MPYFVVQKHTKRTSVHYDLMLEKNGRLLTWSINDICALKKGKEIIKAKKLSDHRMLYLHYEGKISRGRGRVKIWDRGRYKLDQHQGSFTVVTLRGKILKGAYGLVSDSPQKDVWWFIEIS